MRYSEIKCYEAINKTDAAYVRELADSVLADGWTGAPMLVDAESGRLVTGSHRLAALQLIEVEDEDSDIDIDALGDIAEDVSDIVGAWVEPGNDLEYDELGKVFAGTWVEEYASEINEW